MNVRKTVKTVFSAALALLLAVPPAAGVLAAPPGDPPGEPPEGVMGTPPGGQGGSGVTWTGAEEITAGAEEDGKTYASATADENALLIDTAQAVTLRNPTVTKSGDSDGGDNCNFYGINSGVMAKGGGSVSISGGTVSTTATGANGVFSYGGNGGRNGAAGDGTTVTIADTVITTSGDNAGGIMTTGGGVTYAENLTITTSGRSSAPIRTDRGGGTVSVRGGTYTSSGLGSPAIYSTADVTVSGATLVSNLSEGICIEGKNSVTLENCSLSVSNTEMNGNAMFLDSVMLYQSMSGDADSGVSSFTMTGGKLSSSNTGRGHVFHVTNTTAVINLSGVELVNTDGDWLLSVCDDGWSGAENIATLNAKNQTLSGGLMVGDNSTLTLNLSEGSSFTGYVADYVISPGGIAISNSPGTVNVTLSGGSTWTLTGDSRISSFEGDPASVINNGYTLYVDGEALGGTSNASGDAPSDWAKAEIEAAIGTGLVPETLKKNYQQVISRAAVAELFTGLLEQAAGMDIGALLAEHGVEIDRSALRDTDDLSVLAANALGIIKGMGKEFFGGGSPLTRAQLAAVLNRTAGVLGIDTSGYSQSFGDVAGHWVENELGWAVSNGIILGRDSEHFDPDAPLTVQEAIAFVYRALQVLK